MNIKIMQRVILLVVVLCLGAVTAPHITHDDMMLDNEIALNPTAITTALVVGSSIPGSKKDRKPKQPNLQTRWRAENGRNGTKKQVRSCKQLRIPTPVEAASRLNDSLQLNRATSAKEVVKTWIKETLVSLSHISSASTRCDYMLHAALNYGRFKTEEGDNYRSINPLDVAKILEAEIPEVQLTQTKKCTKPLWELWNRTADAKVREAPLNRSKFEELNQEAMDKATVNAEATISGYLRDPNYSKDAPHYVNILMLRSKEESIADAKLNAGMIVNPTDEQVLRITQRSMTLRSEKESLMLDLTNAIVSKAELPKYKVWKEAEDLKARRIINKEAPGSYALKVYEKGAIRMHWSFTDLFKYKLGTRYFLKEDSGEVEVFVNTDKKLRFEDGTPVTRTSPKGTIVHVTLSDQVTEKKLRKTSGACINNDFVGLQGYFGPSNGLKVCFNSARKPYTRQDEKNGLSWLLGDVVSFMLIKPGKFFHYTLSMMKYSLSKDEGESSAVNGLFTHHMCVKEPGKFVPRALTQETKRPSKPSKSSKPASSGKKKPSKTNAKAVKADALELTRTAEANHNFDEYSQNRSGIEEPTIGDADLLNHVEKAVRSDDTSKHERKSNVERAKAAMHGPAKTPTPTPIPFDFTVVPGVGPKKCNALHAAGIISLSDVNSTKLFSLSTLSEADKENILKLV